MNEPITSTAPMPDPSWDYYGLYLAIFDTKARLEEMLHTISTKEAADDALDIKIKAELLRVGQEMENTIDAFLPDDDIYDE